MKFDSIKVYDPSFQLIFSNQALEILDGISSPLYKILDNTIIFVKNKKYLKNILEVKDVKMNSNLLLVEESFLQTISSSELENLKSRFAAIGTVLNVDFSLCYFTKYFYELKISTCQDIVDGRQMGTAQIHPTANIAQQVFIGKNVKIGADVQIHSGCRIMSHTSIEEGTILFPNVTVYPFCKIASGCRVHSGTTIGADGFGYNFSKGEHLKVWHYGGVQIDSFVEIGAGTCIDGGTFFPTQIGSGSKIDNQVQIGHNCKIGRGVILAGQVGISGSTIIGDYTVVGGKAGIGQSIVIGNACQIAGSAMVNANLEDKSVVAGHPARPLKEWLRGIAVVRRLAEKKSEES